MLSFKVVQVIEDDVIWNVGYYLFFDLVVVNRLWFANLSDLELFIGHFKPNWDLSTLILPCAARRIAEYNFLVSLTDDLNTISFMNMPEYV